MCFFVILGRAGVAAALGCVIPSTAVFAVQPISIPIVGNISWHVILFSCIGVDRVASGWRLVSPYQNETTPVVVLVRNVQQI